MWEMRRRLQFRSIPELPITLSSKPSMRQAWRVRPQMRCPISPHNQGKRPREENPQWRHRAAKPADSLTGGAKAENHSRSGGTPFLLRAPSFLPIRNSTAVPERISRLRHSHRQRLSADPSGQAANRILLLRVRLLQFGLQKLF